MENDKFRAYLRAQGMSNTYLPQTNLQPSLCGRNAAQANSFVPYATHQCHGMMTSPGAQQSFFTDGIYHLRDAFEDFEETVRRPLGGQPSCPNFEFKPLAPALPNIALPASSHNINTMTPLAIPGVLASYVDQSQYSPFNEDEWNHASIDYDAPSPDSIDTQTTSPLTPGVEGTDTMFNEYTYRSDNCCDGIGAAFIKSEPLADDTFAANIAPMQHGMSYLVPAIYSDSTSGAFAHSLWQTPGFQDQAFSVPSHHNSFAMPTVMAPRSDDTELVQPQYNMPIIEANPTFHYKPNDFSDDDLREVDQTSGAEDEAPALSDSDDYQPVRAPHAGAHGRSATVEILHDQADKDRYLLRMRRRGVSYREIKRCGRYREAESTLRGRYRVLTKEPSERVRKPEWTPHDEALLRRAVTHFQCKLLAEGRTKASVRKIPWKKVSTWIKAHGGTYLFAPATCASKWDAASD